MCTEFILPQSTGYRISDVQWILQLHLLGNWLPYPLQPA
jgi:hypothetical protein